MNRITFPSVEESRLPDRADIALYSQESVEEFRGSGTGAEQSAAIVGATVAEYEIADIRSLT